MKKIYLLFCFLTSFLACQCQVKLLSPAEFLGYELGDRFTLHYRMVEYFKHVDEAMANVKLVPYGETYEHRPLIYAVVASPENFNNLEQIRQDNLKRAGLLEGSPSGNKVAIVWLSYNVHGDEANSMEASMKTLFELANPANTRSNEWLKNTVVILDPCINPDGRDRYANFYNQYGNTPPNPGTDALEHSEPWPNGRANHYLFDLNRDWSWVTQIESKARIKVYNEWLPHVHVDFHEQGFNDHYYFAPAAEPFHEVISDWQREFQTMIGKNNAKYFDEQGWLYFTKERFDLYYPGFGDTYPTFNGAIGLTYEQAGSAGLTITTREGDPLTLKDRLTHHHTAGISTIEITSKNAAKVIDEFEKYFKENLNGGSAIFKSYVIKGDNNPDKLNQITRWMDSHSIKYGNPTSGRPLKGFDYQTQATTQFNLSTEDLVISSYQPKSRFITTLFEPQSKLRDSLTYDITAWNLIYNYDLNAFAVNERITTTRTFQPKATDNPSLITTPYAYIFKYQSVNDVEFLASLLQKNVKVRSATKSFSASGQNFEPGTIIVTRRNNEGIADFDKVVVNLAREKGRNIYTTTTGFVEKGKDIGSDYVNFIKPPKVAVIFGDQTASVNAGEIWYFFEQQLHYPITQLGTDYVKTVDLKKYDVLVVPEGNYRLFDDVFLEQVTAWVSGGGRLIIIANGLNAFAEKKGFSLKAFATEAEKTESEKKEKEAKEKGALTHFEDAERKNVSDRIRGAIYKVTLDKSHPLAFGLEDTYYTLKNNRLRFGFLENGWNVGIIKGDAKPVMGFAGYRMNKKLSNSLVMGVEEKGKGNIVYLVDNPLFRSFWESGKLLFANAVFMVGQ